MKKNIKKYLLMALSLVLVSAISIVGTIAYLMDTDSALNTFTVGNVDISLKEDVGVIGEGADYVQTEDGTEYTGVMPGDYLKKTVTVTNEGNTPAYVAVTVTVNNALEINKAIDEVYEAKGYTPEQIQGIYDIVFDGWGLNYNKVDADGNALGMRLTITDEDMPEGVEQVDSVKTLDEYWQQYSGNWFMDTKTVIPFNGYYTTGMNKYELRYTYYMLLEEKGETVTLFNGLNVPEVFNKEQLAMFEGLNINIEAAAIQAGNFSDAKVAFATLKQEMADGQNDGVKLPVVANDTELNAAIAKGAEEIILESGNYGVIDVTVNRNLTISAAANADVKIAGIDGQSNNNSTNVTIKGVTIDNSLQTEGWYTGTAQKIKPCVGVWGGNYTFENCTFSVTGASGAETGVMSWWTTNKGVMNFTNCTFNGGNGSARGMQIYGNYDLNVTNCTFNTAKDYSIKYVGAEGCVATFKNNNVNATANFVQTGSAPYAGANYSLVFEGNTLTAGINHVYVDNAEGQTITINGVVKAATNGAIY